MKKLKYICILLFGVLEINAQEFPVIGQYIFNEMILNPASIFGKMDSLHGFRIGRQVFGHFGKSNLHLSERPQK